MTDKYDISKPIIIPGLKKQNLNVNIEIAKEDEKRMLGPYVKVRRPYWIDIRPWTHIRYRTKDGVLHVGGMMVFKGLCTDMDYSAGEAVQYFRLVYKFDDVAKPSGKKAFNVKIDDIIEIYAHIDGVSQSICEVNREAIEKLSSGILQLSERIRRLEVKST